MLIPIHLLNLTVLSFVALFTALNIWLISVDDTRANSLRQNYGRVIKAYQTEIPVGVRERQRNQSQPALSR